MDVIQLTLETILPVIFTTLLGLFTHIVRKQKSDMEALKDGMRACLRSRLYDLHEAYVMQGSGCPRWVKEEAERVYEAYHTLGGNHTGTETFHQIMKAKIKKGENHD